MKTGKLAITVDLFSHTLTKDIINVIGDIATNVFRYTHLEVISCATLGPVVVLMLMLLP